MKSRLSTALAAVALIACSAFGSDCPAAAADARAAISGSSGRWTSCSGESFPKAARPIPPASLTTPPPPNRRSMRSRPAARRARAADGGHASSDRGERQPPAQRRDRLGQLKSDEDQRISALEQRNQRAPPQRRRHAAGTPPPAPRVPKPKPKPRRRLQAEATPPAPPRRRRRGGCREPTPARTPTLRASTCGKRAITTRRSHVEGVRHRLSEAPPRQLREQPHRPSAARQGRARGPRPTRCWRTIATILGATAHPTASSISARR